MKERDDGQEMGERERERKEGRKGVRRLTFRGNPPQTLEFALLGFAS